MSISLVKEYLSQWGRDEDVLEFPVSSATVELAAQALSTEPKRIANRRRRRRVHNRSFGR